MKSQEKNVENQPNNANNANNQAVKAPGLYPSTLLQYRVDNSSQKRLRPPKTSGSDAASDYGNSSAIINQINQAARIPQPVHRIIHHLSSQLSNSHSNPNSNPAAPQTETETDESAASQNANSAVAARSAAEQPQQQRNWNSSEAERAATANGNTNGNTNACRQVVFRQVLSELYKPKPRFSIGPGTSPALIASVLAAVRHSLTADALCTTAFFPFLKYLANIINSDCFSSHMKKTE